MSGRESRRAARRARRPHAQWHGSAASPRGSSFEFDSRMAYGNEYGNESTRPPHAASRLEGGSTSGCGVGARRARSVEVDTWARGTAGLSRGYDERLGPSRQPRLVPSESAQTY